MTTEEFNDLLKNQPLVIDGGWGTELHALGLPAGTSPELWNLEEPEKVGQVARRYVDAGSDIIITNTFGGSSLKLAEYQLADRAAEINRRGAEISKEAAASTAKVFASIGPCGKMLMMEEVSEEEMEASFSEQAQALADGGADAIVIETMSGLEEASIALKAARKTGIPVVVSLVYDSGMDKDRTMMGVSPAQAAERLAAEGAAAIGANCGQGIAGFVSLCRQYREVTSLPLWVKANAGLPEMVDGKVVYHETPADFASKVPELINAGAAFIGGCCGTNPDFIREIKKAVQSL